MATSDSDFKTSRHYRAGVSQNISAGVCAFSLAAHKPEGDGGFFGVATDFGTMNHDEPKIIIGEREGWGGSAPFGISAETNDIISISSERRVLGNQRCFVT
jgi:hypothetical protein